MSKHIKSLTPAQAGRRADWLLIQTFILMPLSVVTLVLLTNKWARKQTDALFNQSTTK